MAKNKDATRHASDVQEDRVAAKLGGFRTSNSGAGLFRKGDIHVVSASTLVECKTCMSPKDSFSIKKEWILKNREEAFANRLSHTVIAFNFNYEDPQDYYVIDDRLMRFLIEKLEEEYKSVDN